jgi:putative PIN family toxin of toxin-antitoxin system
MRVVVDTNVSVSGLLWSGPPNQILKWARDGRLQILASHQTVTELERVIQYPRFSRRLSDLQVTAQEVFAYFMNIVHFVADVEKAPEIIRDDQFDSIFLALAAKHYARLIISGNQHLLKLRRFRSIQIVTPAEAVQVVEKLQST